MAANDFNAGFGLPLEYQSEVDSLARRRAIAQALQTQTMQPTQVQQLGRRASKLPPLAVLGNVLASYLSGQTADKADQSAKEVATRARDEGLSEMGDLTGMGDNKAKIAAAMVSRFPGIRQQGQTWQTAQTALDLEEQKARHSRLQAGATSIMAQDPATGMRMLETGQVPPNYAAPPPGPVEFGQSGEDRYALVPQPGGKRDFSWARRPDKTNVSMGGVNLPGQKVGFEEWAKAAVKDNQAMGANARSAQNLVQTLGQMGSLDEQGLVAGPIANPILFLTGLAKQVNLPIDENKLANSQTYNSLAQKAVQELIGQFGGNRGVTKEEAAQIAQSLPQLQQSLEARKLLSTVLTKVAQRQIAEYRQSTGMLNDALKTEDMTKYNFGPVQFPDTPAVPNTAPAGASPLMPLSPEEARELQRLRRRPR